MTWPIVSCWASRTRDTLSPDCRIVAMSGWYVASSVASRLENGISVLSRFS